MDTSQRTRIACAACAYSKSKCDKLLPCSNCIHRGTVCEPRHSVRIPSAARRTPRNRQVARSQVPTSTETSEERKKASRAFERPSTPSSLSAHDSVLSRSTAFEQVEPLLYNDNSGSGLTTTPEDAFSRAYAAHPGMNYALSPASNQMLSQRPITPLSDLNFDFMDDVALAPADWDMFSDLTGQSCMVPQIGNYDDPSASALMCVMPTEARHVPVAPQVTPVSSRALEAPRIPQIPETTSDATSIASGLEVWPIINCNAAEGVKSNRNYATQHIEDLIALLGDAQSWGEWEREPRRDTYEVYGSGVDPMRGDTRDQLLVATQGFLDSATQSQILGASLGSFGSQSSSIPSRGLRRAFIVLPPSHVLNHFLGMYMRSVELYRNLAPAATIRTNDIIRYQSTDLGSLLLVLLIAQGASMGASDEAQKIARGFTEICKHALSDVVRDRNISETMVGRCALQFIGLCAWSGVKSHMELAVSQRALFLSMLGPAGMFVDSVSNPSAEDCRKDPQGSQNIWREREWRCRLVHSWVMIDQEMSLFYDLPPLLPINDLNIPLHQHDHLWLASSTEEWSMLYLQSINGGSTLAPSAQALFVRFIQGELADTKDISAKHLRLLLHPLQAMAVSSQSLLRCFDKSSHRHRSRVISRHSLLARMQEVEDLLDQWSDLHDRCIKPPEDGTLDHPDSATLIMFHLITLNTFTCIPELDRVAQRNPPSSATERATLWTDMHNPGSDRSIIYHAGQIFRLIDQISLDLRPPWWSIAVYRAALACWSVGVFGFSQAAQQGSNKQVIVINKVAPSDRVVELYLRHKSGNAMIMDRHYRARPVSEGNSVLEYCLELLTEGYQTTLVCGVRDRVTRLLERWQT